ncbi:MAG: hypothetical protein CL678_03375 [Bdellovibrionaceae bacterium]|nr:hypothetical protein [Pseudobdellovibrionaceae bacterium]|tara:strand:- start:155 stop:508 length:354 start_codon:yes stop_codon:yes gene_type:complete
MRYGILIVLSLILIHCSSVAKKPCDRGGDISWPIQYKGDRHCRKVLSPEGYHVNHGDYSQFDQEGRLRLKGEFKYGLKHGYWTQYDEKGVLEVRKYFEDGEFKKVVEKKKRVWKPHD